MSEVHETGHTKNVNTFFSLIGFVKGWGTDYQPTNPALAVANLETLHPLCEKAVKDADDEEKTFDDLVDKRIAAFKPLKPYATRIVNSFSTIDLPEESVAGAREINRKIQGKRATPKAGESIAPIEGEAAANGKKSISASQMSFDNNVRHINDLRAWVELQETYNPNEADLKVAAIKTFHDKLDAANKAVLKGLVPYENKLDARDLLLYADKTGMVDIALAVKKYAKGAFGATSAKYKQISGLKFRKLPRKK
jgi:hypothetical protein